MTKPILVWLRRDLRLADNPALAEAAGENRPILPVVIRDDGDALWPPGGAARWWRGESLAALARDLEERGSRLILRSGRPADILDDLIAETGADAIYYNLSYEPAIHAADLRIAERQAAKGVTVRRFPGNRLHEPWAFKTQSGGSFKVFTPFWRSLAQSYRNPARMASPSRLMPPPTWPRSESLADWRESATWAQSLARHWQPGEAGARARLAEFIAGGRDYGERRDRPDLPGTSRLSPHLAWGEISVHRVWGDLAGAHGEAAIAYHRELAWRDFNTHLLWHFPDLPERAWSPIFRDFPYADRPKDWRAWTLGRTGYPLVDAGMRELWRTGWMHNRVRMVAASFLIKDLGIDWRRGQAWFWDTLVDADLAQNAGNWQWVAGSGADAAPYFRIFNPLTQSRRFDPTGAYIRRWVPELGGMDNDAIHDPHADLLSTQRDYPAPIVDHDAARRAALDLYRRQSDLFRSGQT